MSTASTVKLKHYNLSLPEELFNQLKAVADQRQTTVLELLRKFTKLGLMAVRVEDNPGASLVLREGDRERELLLF